MCVCVCVCGGGGGQLLVCVCDCCNMLYIHMLQWRSSGGYWKERERVQALDSYMYTVP